MLRAATFPTSGPHAAIRSVEEYSVLSCSGRPGPHERPAAVDSPTRGE